MESDQLDGIASVRGYIDRLVTGDGRCHGMKVLLLDATTTQILSCVTSQSEILSREVYLVSRIDDPRGGGGSGARNDDDDDLALREEGSSGSGTSSAHVGHMKAVCFLRPTEINVGHLVRELARPRFSEYHIYFSGILPPSLLDLLADSDARERVRQVQEFYADFLPINPDLLSLDCRGALLPATGAGGGTDRAAALYRRNLEGLRSMLLALKRQPAAIRCQGSSDAARRLAADVGEGIGSDQIFHFRRGSGRRAGGAGSTLLLVLDRMDDPVTPLLSQWTYQAMVHELLGLNNSRVVLRGVPNVPEDLEEVVLSSAPGHDAFFRSHRNSNFGELGEAIQKLLRDYQARSKQNNTTNLKSIEDMQQFLDKYPEMRTQSHTVSKHVAIMGELARLVEVCSLMDVSAFEQDLACADDQAGHLKELVAKLDSHTVKIPDKLRLGMLYALRYENSAANAIPAVKEAMRRGGVAPDNVALVDAVLRYAGSKARGPGLYGTNKDVTSMMKSFMTSVQGVSNVYAQHSPVLMDTLEGAAKGKLRGETHPLILPGGRSSSNVEGVPLPQEILVYMVGGVTYEESTKVNQFNQTNVGKVRVILGGSTVHNSTSFLEELKLMYV